MPFPASIKLNKTEQSEEGYARDHATVIGVVLRANILFLLDLRP